jgi:hypothetical protein
LLTGSAAKDRLELKLIIAKAKLERYFFIA